MLGAMLLEVRWAHYGNYVALALNGNILIDFLVKVPSFPLTVMTFPLIDKSIPAGMFMGDLPTRDMT